MPDPQLERRLALVEEYQRAVQQYQWTVLKLNDKRPTASKAEYEALKVAVEEARQQCDRLKAQLDRNRTENRATQV